MVADMPIALQKGAVRTMSKNVAIDFARDNIRVNTIHPGSIFYTDHGESRIEF